MDYSAFYPSIIIEYLTDFAGCILIIIFLIYGEIYLVKKYLKSKSIVKSIIEVIGGILCIIAIIASTYFSRNYFKDIPNIINKNYIIANGTVTIGNNGGTAYESRGITFRKDNGETIDLYVVYLPIHNGDRFEVIYLPNTGAGAIVQKIEETEVP